MHIIAKQLLHNHKSRIYSRMSCSHCWFRGRSVEVIGHSITTRQQCIFVYRFVNVTLLICSKISWDVCPFAMPNLSSFRAQMVVMYVRFWYNVIKRIGWPHQPFRINNSTLCSERWVTVVTRQMAGFKIVVACILPYINRAQSFHREKNA